MSVKIFGVKGLGGSAGFVISVVTWLIDRFLNSDKVLNLPDPGGKLGETVSQKKIH